MVTLRPMRKCGDSFLLLGESGEYYRNLDASGDYFQDTQVASSEFVEYVGLLQYSVFMLARI